MKHLFQSFLGVALLGVIAPPLSAQPAPKIAIVDLGKAYDTHYKTEEQNAKLKVDQQKAEEELQKINAAGNALVVRYKELAEQAKNPALTADARGKAEAEVQKVGEEIQRKQTEVGTFRDTTARQFQDRVKNFRDLMLEEIRKVATEIARRKGATLLLDKAGPTLFGTSNVIYFDPGYDITDEVVKELAKDRPATTSLLPSSAPKATSNTAPSITVPGAAPKK
jgi:outer membrane protein